MAINSSLESLRVSISHEVGDIRVECLKESRQTLEEMRIMCDALIKTNREGWEGVIDAMRKPITVPSPPPLHDERDALEALGVMRAKQPTLSEIVHAVDEEKLKRDGRAVENFSKAVRKGMHDGVRKGIAYAIGFLLIWMLRDLLPHARILPTSATVEPAGATLAPVPSK